MKLSLANKFFLAALLFFVQTLFVHAQDFPPIPKSLVSDYTNTLSEGELESLRNTVHGFEDSTGVQIAIAMLASTGRYEIADYGVKLFNEWQIGDKEKSSGVLLLVAKSDRKVFIITGRGSEGVLPDVVCKRIVDNEITPRFKSGDFFGGLNAAATTMISIMKNEYSADSYMKKSKKNRGKNNDPWAFLIVFVVILLIIFSKVSGVRRYAHRNNISFWLAWSLLNAAANRGRSSSGWSNWSGGGGSSGWGGGGSSWGGFGGGSSGGGGAGGSW